MSGNMRKMHCHTLNALKCCYSMWQEHLASLMHALSTCRWHDLHLSHGGEREREREREGGGGGRVCVCVYCILLHKGYSSSSLASSSTTNPSLMEETQCALSGGKSYYPWQYKEDIPLDLDSGPSYTTMECTKTTSEMRTPSLIWTSIMNGPN